MECYLMVISKYKKEYREFEEQTTKHIVDFDTRAIFRIRTEDIKIVNKIVKKDDEKYDNISHFYRCAVLKLIREEKQRLNIK